ncbi:MAG TPA: asparagine synthase (glutamine-hydrolyzing) [Anaerolineae bacterium]|nr:asparagine synthase (glutamine-hydrolyzing) [Anaerolineae bacterium]
MCGICGIVHANSQHIDKDRLRKMNAALEHRGPDNEGFFTDRGIGLAMRRLKIIDLATGDQPISNENNMLWVILNGEIYNYISLRKDLIKSGHSFKTNSDTECLLHLFEDHGTSLFQYLRGMFAFALWDKKEQRLLLARDRLGQKPLYYTLQNGSIYFSSELPSLLIGLDEKPDIDLNAIDQYLSLQYIPNPYTPFQGIYKLPAAHFLIWHKSKVTINRYWKLEHLPKLTDPKDALIEQLQTRIREAVKLRMISDVPLGAHLSGGIDSSIIVSEMAQCSSVPVKTFSIGFEENHFSEIPYARTVADYFQTEHTEFILKYKDIPETLETIVNQIGEPLADPSVIPLYFLSKLTRKYVTVALNGDGGDESFAGYQRYWLDPWANLYQKFPSFLTQKCLPAIANHIPDKSERPIGASFINGLKRLKTVAKVNSSASILRWSSYFSLEQKRKLWKHQFKHLLKTDQAERYLSCLFEGAYATRFLDRTLYTDISSYLPSNLLVKADRMTMAHSLEARSPFLDHKLVSWAASLPVKMKVRQFKGKYLLRKAYSKQLPKTVMSRGKQGFGIPISKWFRGPLLDWGQELLLNNNGVFNEWFEKSEIRKLFTEHKSGKYDHGKRIWALVVLNLWCKLQEV